MKWKALEGENLAKQLLSKQYVSSNWNLLKSNPGHFFAIGFYDLHVLNPVWHGVGYIYPYVFFGSDFEVVFGLCLPLWFNRVLMDNL